MEIISRAYNTFDVNYEKGTITKKSKTKRLWDEAQYYLNIPKEFQIYFPRIVRASVDGEGPNNEPVYTIEMEYYPSYDLGKHLIGEHPLTSTEWVEIFDNLYDVLELWSAYQWEPHLKNQMWKHGYEMYISKTVREFHNFVNQRIWPDLFKSSKIFYNGKEYINFIDIWEMFAKKYIQDHILDNVTFTFIHGDLCFANILYVDRHLRFVDPRGSFGSPGVSGDPRYDVAKLSHSVYGHYEVLNNNQFTLEHPTEKEWFVTPLCSVQNVGAFFDQRFFHTNSRFSRKEIRTIEGLIFVGACARHYDNKDRQAALYLRGVQALNEAMTLGD